MNMIRVLHSNQFLKVNFHASLFSLKFGRLPKLKPHQISIAFNTETPAYHSEEYKNFSRLNPWVNWTGTHRSDSDLQWPYGFFYEVPKGETEDINVTTENLVTLK